MRRLAFAWRGRRREMGLPAVVLPGATQMFADNELIKVDGNRGWVARANEVAKPSTVDSRNPNDTRIPAELIPPGPGHKDRVAANLRNVCAAVWTIILLGFFLLPETIVRQPTLAAIDLVLWPLVRNVGKPATVAIIAASLAIVALLIQKFVTDNERLREARRRAAVLQREAKTLPAKSPRRRAIGRLISGVQTNSLLASLVPIGILLGPMALPFVWFSERIDPVAAGAPPGSAVQIVAQVQGDWQHPARLEVTQNVALDDTTPATRSLPPIRKTLERLLTLLTQLPNDKNQSWELQVISAPMRQQAVEDLKSYLAAAIPPQGLTWTLRPPKDFTGTFEVTVNSAGAQPIATKVCLGDLYPPEPAVVTRTKNSPLVQLSVVYPKLKVAQVFWQPFSKLGDYVPAGFARVSVANWLAAIDIGWMTLYLIVYISVILAARKLFSVS